MKPEKIENLRRRVGERGSASAALTRGEVVTVIRRFGFVVMKAYEIMVSRAIADGDRELAEELGDCVKPVADWLIHFELGEVLKTDAAVPAFEELDGEK